MTETKIIYESFNGYNIVIEVDNGYCIINANGDTVLFKDKKVLKAVMRNIKKHGNLQYHPNNSSGWYWVDSDGKMLFNLSQLVWATHKGMSIRQAKKARIKYKNGNANDLRIENLYMPLGAEVIKHENYICMVDHEHQKVSVADYSDELFAILNRFSINYNRKRDYFRITIDKKTIDISYVCFVVYHYDANKRNIVRIINRLKKDLVKESPNDRSGQLILDHKDGNHHNNTKHNLQILKHGLNAKKSNLNKKLRHNQFYYPILLDSKTGAGEIAGRMNHKTDLWGTLYFLCTGAFAYDIELLPFQQDAEKRVDNLIQMIKRNEMPEDKIRLPISHLQYSLLALKGLALLSKLYHEVQNKNKKI